MRAKISRETEVTIKATLQGSEQETRVKAINNAANYYTNKSEEFAEISKQYSEDSEDYSNLAKDWANKLGETVDGLEYSSKYYAQKAKEAFQDTSEQVKRIEDTTQEGIDLINETKNQGLADIETSKDGAVASIGQEKTDSLEDIQNARVIALGEITSANAQLDNKIAQATLNVENAETIALNNINETKNNAITNVNDIADARIEEIDIKSDSFLTESQISNCLTEIPQRIKLELNNGTLILKAGSVVIVPNGFEADGTTPKFNDVEVENDLNNTPSYTYTGKVVVLFDAGGGIRTERIEIVSSGGTPGHYDLYGDWYDTTNNLVKRTINSGATWLGNESFPIALCSYSNGVTSIDQVFNGMGYIGSTVWVDKGVKGLIPDGRNEDGSLKNIEFETEKVVIETLSSTTNDNFRYYLAREDIYSKQIWRQIIEHDWISEKEPTQHTYSYWYNPQTNIAKRSHNDASVWIDSWASLPVFTCTVVNGVISNFQPKTTFHAIDYNDKSEISSWGMPSNKYIDLTLGASETTYTAPANGYFLITKNSNANNQYLNGYNRGTNGNDRIYAVSRVAPVVGTYSITIPAKKNDKVMIVYNMAGTTAFFRFVYAEGEV